MPHPQTVTLAPSKPRNPLVAASRFRHAGRHGAGAGALRQAAGRALRRELNAAAHDKPPSV